MVHVGYELLGEFVWHKVEKQRLGSGESKGVTAREKRSELTEGSPCP